MITFFYLVFSIQLTLAGLIEQLNNNMEEAFNNGNLQTVADFYADDAAIINVSDHVVTGREDIRNYWSLIGDPVKWKLDVIEVSIVEEDIYNNEYYQSLENKPPDWREKGFDFSKEEANLVYQLGHSTLKTRHKGKVQTSEVDFILVWKSTDDGFKILVDTYCSQ